MTHFKRYFLAIALAIGFPSVAWAQLCGQTCAGTGGLHYTSAEGDWIGQGETRSLDAPPNLLQAVRKHFPDTPYDGFDIRVNMPQEGGTGEYWTIMFAMPNAAVPAPGTYAAERFHSSTVAGLDMFGNGRGCNEVVGQFTIHEISFKQDGGIQSVAVDYTHRCGATQPLLTAQVRFNSTWPFTDGPVTPPGPIVDTDGDGIPDSVETSEGRNPLVKDNDVFASDRLFVMQMYRDFMAREGDAAGIAFWMGQMSAGMTRAQVAQQFLTSAEFALDSAVARLYLATYLRIPDAAGLNYWIDAQAQGSSLEDIADEFVRSQEFLDRYGMVGNKEFVTLMYVNVLGRAPDATGHATWLAHIDNLRMTWGDVLAAFSESAEFKTLSYNETVVIYAYVRMLRRTPDSGGFAAWLGYLDAGNAATSFVELILASPEYRARFLP